MLALTQQIALNGKVVSLHLAVFVYGIVVQYKTVRIELIDNKYDVLTPMRMDPPSISKGHDESSSSLLQITANRSNLRDLDIAWMKDIETLGLCRKLQWRQAPGSGNSMFG